MYRSTENNNGLTASFSIFQCNVPEIFFKRQRRVAHNRFQGNRLCHVVVQSEFFVYVGIVFLFVFGLLQALWPFLGGGGGDSQLARVFFPLAIIIPTFILLAIWTFWAVKISYAYTHVHLTVKSAMSKIATKTVNSTS